MGLGLIRLLLALVVVVDHTDLPIVYINISSTTAVECFFVISGFYMAMILTEKYQRVKFFYLSRLLRILPVYWLVLGLSFGYELFTYQTSGQLIRLSGVFDLMEVSSLASLVVMMANMILFGQDWLAFIGLVGDKLTFVSNPQVFNSALIHYLLIPQSWTLGMELTFYLLAPLLIKRSSILIGGLAALGIGIKLILDQIGFGGEPFKYRFFPIELAFFLLGVLAYKFYLSLKKSSLPNFLYWWVSQLFIGVFIGWGVFRMAPEIKTWYLFSLLVFSLPFLFEFSKNYRIDRWLGELSYPIYLIHFLVISWLKMNAYSSDLFIAYTLIVSLIAAILIHYLLQRPIDRWRHQQQNKKSEV